MTDDKVTEATNNYLTFYVNRKKIVEKKAEPHWTLVYYLRTSMYRPITDRFYLYRLELHLTGTKVGCGTGGCGASKNRQT